MSLNESQGEERKQNAECRKKEITKMRRRKEGEIKDTKSGMTFFRKKKKSLGERNGRDILPQARAITATHDS